MSFTVKDILFIIFRYKNGLILFSIYLCLGMGLFMLCSKRMYESHAEILVRFGQEQLGIATLGAADRNVYFSRREQEVQNELRILSSNDTLMAAARTIAGSEASVEDLLEVKAYLSENLTASALKDSDVVDVSFLYPDPVVAQKTLQVILRQYQSHHGSVYFDSNELALVSGKLESARREYAEALQALTAFEAANKSSDEKQILSLSEQRDQQKLTLNGLISEHAYVVQKRDMTMVALNDLPQNILYSVREVRNGSRARLTERMSELQLQRQALLGRYTENSRMITDIDKEINLLNKHLASEPERLIDDQETRTNETRNNLQQALLDLTPEVEAQRARIDSMTEQVQELDAELARAISAKGSYALLSRDVEVKKDIYDRYYQNYSDAIGREAAQQQSITNASVVEMPSLNVEPLEPKKKRLAALGLALLVAGNVFIVFVSFFLDTTLAWPEQVEWALKYPVVGVFNARHGKTENAGQIGWGGPTPEKRYRVERQDFGRLFLKVTKPNQPGCFLFSSTEPNSEFLSLVEDFASFAKEYPQRLPVIVRYVTDDSGLLCPTSEDGWPLPVRQLNGIDEYQIYDTIDIQRNAAFLESLKEQYDLLVLSFAPIQDSPLLIALANHLDWVLYGITAEKTNKYVASSAIGTLVQFGFEKIGLVLSERRFHIPAFLYRYL